MTTAAAVAEAAPLTATPSSAPVSTGGVALRRGLPRIAGGPPWPPEGFAPSSEKGLDAESALSPTGDALSPTGDALSPTGDALSPTGGALSRTGGALSRTGGALSRTGDALSREEERQQLAPLPFSQTVFPGAAAEAWNARRRDATPTTPPPEPQRIGPFTRLQWIGAAIVGGGGLLVAGALLVLAVRWLLSLPALEDFLTTYPGEYHLPDSAPVGIPVWLNWQHFLNSFFLVLIIRSGLQVRNEKRPSVFWSPRGNKRRKISLALWFHQALDILWIVNGLLFVVLLFATGQWMRLVPTSWEVFPNALSAALQYASLDWPTENGWVNYNSLQQLAYFSITFLAAPLAIVTGVRMSGVWPKEAKTLNRLYPVEVARMLHFPTMIFFVLFIVVHVALVFATGALRNLNHMYAAQGSTDPDASAANWTGFWIFALSTLAIVAAWVAARPLVLAPIARLFGTVKGR